MKIGVIGCGNMASIVVKAMKKKNPNLRFYTYTPSFTRAEALAKEIQGEAFKNIDELKGLDAYILGHKPQQIKEVSDNFKEITKDKIIFSMLAAINITNLKEYFLSSKIIRIMPNTPIAKELGIVLETSSKELNPQEKELLIGALENSSSIINCKDDKELDDLTTIFGCGPAYVYYFSQVIKNKLEKISPELKNQNELISKLLIGSSCMIQQNEITIQDEIDRVTSKGGVTIEAVKVLKASDFNEVFDIAIDKALSRTEELSEQMNLFS